MSHLSPGLISAYNSLTDKHLAGYFSNTRIRRHLQRAGLITRSGRIVPDKEYRHKLMQRAQQRHIRECLAHAIFQKVLEMERIHQGEIRRKLEEFAKRERVQKIKVERSKRYEEEIIRILSPRPPTGARGVRPQHSGPEAEHTESSESPGSSRPNTAPGKMQRPVRLKPIHSSSTTASLRRSSPYRHRESSNEAEQPFSSTRESRRHLTTTDFSHGLSPYCLPVINNFVTPVPPSTKRKNRGVKMTASGTVRGRRLHHTAVYQGPDVFEESHMLKSSVHQSRVCVNMVYFGKTVHLSHDLTDLRDEVKVFQQHCGGENLCVYKGKLHEGESFQFVSRRHRGFPFSLTFYLNGLQVDRLSSCCEFKHRKGSRLGGRHGHFGFSSVDGAAPCYKCIIAMGLDKKPTPPPKRAREEEETVGSPKDAAETDRERTDGDTASQSASPSSQPQDTETPAKDEPPSVEDKVRDDYEEDFEADDEGPAEDTEAKDKISPSSFSESERPVRDASETDDEEKDDDRTSQSAHSPAGSDGDESDAEDAKDSRGEEDVEDPKDSRGEEDVEDTKDSKEEEDADQPGDKEEDSQQADRPEPCAPPADEDEANAEETKPTEAKDSDIQDSPGDSTGWAELEVSYSSTPPGKDKEAEQTVGESKREEEEEERAKSVQEKLAEAILQEAQCSSEPELSDTSTEEEEEAVAGKESKDAVLEKSAAEAQQQQQPDTEEVKCEESAAEEQKEEETSETKEPEDETERENGNGDEMGEKDKDEEKVASEVDEEDTDAQPVSEEKMAEDENKSEAQEEAQEEAPNETAEAEAAEKDEAVEEEKSAGEDDIQSDVTGQAAKRSEEDESSASEIKQSTEEPAVAEADTGETAREMKAEPSEETEATSCQEAPVTDTERQADGDEAAGGSEVEVKAEHASSSSKETGDTVVHAEETTGTGEESRKEETSEGDKEEKAEGASGEAEEEGDKGAEERQETNVEDEKEETDKSGDVQGGDEETKPEEIPEEMMEKEESTEKEESAEKEESEEKEEKEEDVPDVTEKEANAEEKGKEEVVEEIVEKEDDAVSEVKDDDDNCGKTEKDEDGSKAEDAECVKSKEDEEESDTIGKTVEKEEANEQSRDANEEKRDEAGEDVTEEPEKAAEEDVDDAKEKVDISAEDVDDQETGDEANKTKGEEEGNNTTEPEDEKKESESGEVDAENGEISTPGEVISMDEAESPNRGEDDGETAKVEEDEKKPEEAPEDEGTEVRTETEQDKMEKGEDAEGQQEKCEETETVEDNQQESSPKESEMLGKEIKEEGDDLHTDGHKAEDEETEQNAELKQGHEADADNEDGKDVKEETVAPASDPIQVLQHLADGLDSAAPRSEKENEEEEGKNEEPATPHSSQVPLAESEAAAAVEGENGADAEEASKPSEEGASVLLKPEADSSQLPTHNKEEEEEAKGEIEEERKDQEDHTVTPDVLEQEDNTDLVTNWITKHQSSRFFEKFVEPLDDLNAAQTSNSSTDGTRAKSPVKTSDGEAADGPGATGKEATKRDEDQSEDKTNVEAKLSELSKDEEPSENDAAKDKQHEKEEEEKEKEEEETKVMSITESEQDGKESSVRQEENKGSKASLQEDVPPQGETEETDVSKTETENAAAHHSVSSDRPESLTQNQEEEEENTVETFSDINENQTPIEEIKDRSSPKVEDVPERPKSAENLSEPASLEVKAAEQEDDKDTKEKGEEESMEVTELTDFTTAQSEDGNQVEPQPHPSSGSVSGGRKDLELMADIRHTLSKDQLSTFSLDSNLFGQSSFPPLAAARSESSH